MAWNINNLTDSKKGDMYKSLANKSYAEVGAEYKIDIHYSNQSGVRNAVYRIAKQVEAEPDKFGVTKEIVDIVQKSAKERKQRPQTQIQEKDDSAIMDFSDSKAVTIGGRNKAAELLHRKMDQLNSSKSALEKQSLVSLATVYGIFFDKSQILQGQATENIAVMAKITKDMTPEESLDELLKMREVQMEEAGKK